MSQNVDLIFSNYSNYKPRLEKDKKGKKYYSFRTKIKNFDADLLSSIISFSTSILEKPKLIRNIEFNFDSIELQDKLSYIYFECICFYLISQGFVVSVYLEVTRNVVSSGIYDSPIKYLHPHNGNYSLEKFLTEFQVKYTRTHLRLWVTSKNDFSSFSSTIVSFLKNLFIIDDKKILFSIANTIGELVGNAIEHGRSDCLVDIDYSDSFVHIQKPDRNFSALNVVILNFSTIKMGDLVKNKITQSHPCKMGVKYQDIKRIYNIHETFFNQQYTENIFWIIASLQHEISGRQDTMISGGRGSTKLLKSIIDYSESNYCYIMSGHELVKFHHNLLNEDSQGYVSFSNSDFQSAKPEKEVYSKSKIYLPGVGYNLNFVLEKKDSEDERNKVNV